MKSLVLLSLLSVLYGTAVSVIREYFYNSQPMTWTAAEDYCRKNHGHLATITTEEEFRRAVGSGTNLYLAWIGLYRTVPHENIWNWSNGENNNFTKWNTNEPDDRGSGEDCVIMNAYAWFDSNCGKNYASICSRSIILVKERKTWEEALQHCRTHYTDLVFVEFKDLAPKWDPKSSVWTGLRFLDGKWFWLNGVSMGSQGSLPQCPIHPYSCGSYNFNTSFWENRDCNEKLNFLCYEKETPTGQ